MVLHLKYPLTALTRCVSHMETWAGPSCFGECNRGATGHRSKYQQDNILILLFQGNGYRLMPSSLWFCSEPLVWNGRDDRTMPPTVL